MSGGGGSNSSEYPAGRAAGESVECASLEFSAPLLSPIPAVISTVSVGTVCEVILEGSPSQLVLYVRSSGEQLGAIIERMMILLRCIDRGFAYEAEVITTEPIRVRVRPRRPYRLGLPFTAAVTDVPSGTPFTAGEIFELRLDNSGRVIMCDSAGAAAGLIRAEPVALPDAVRSGYVTTATITVGPAGATSPRVTVGAR